MTPHTATLKPHEHEHEHTLDEIVDAAIDTIDESLTDEGMDDPALDDVHPLANAEPEPEPEVELLANERVSDRSHPVQGELLDLSDLAELSQVTVIPSDASAGEVVELASKRIPLNEFNLPRYIFRGDMLPAYGVLSNEALDNAAIMLDYSQGFPAQPDSSPIWEKMSHEHAQAHLLFVRYVQQVEELGVRQLHILAHDEKVPLETVVEYSKMYYWGWRSRAYDLFEIAADRKRREIRARRADNDDFAKMSALIEKLHTSLEDVDFGMVAPEDRIDMLNKLIALRKASVAVQAGGSQKGNGGNGVAANASVEMIMRQVVAVANPAADAKKDTGQLAKMLGNPNMMKIAQELTIKMQQRGNADAEEMD